MSAPFVMLPVAIVRDPSLRPTQKLVLAAYLAYTGKNKRDCFPAQATVAKQLGLNRGTVNDAMKVLVEHGVVRRVRKGRGFKYDLGPVYEMLENPAPSQQKIEKPSYVSAPGESDQPVSTTLLPEKATNGAGRAVTNYISVSDQENYTTVASRDHMLGSEAEALSGHDLGVRSDDLVMDDAPTPTSGSGAPNGGGFKLDAQRAAFRLGLATHCPEDQDWAREDINEAIMLVGGERLNRGTLDKLIERFGIIACWSQAKYLDERIKRYPTAVEKPTALYVRSVEVDAGRQGGQSRQERIDDFVDRFCKGEIEFTAFPKDLADDIWQAIPDDKIPF